MRTLDFFLYAQERYRILLNRRAGLPRPWTHDPILQGYRFCNVFREDDSTTQWIRGVVHERAYTTHLLGAMVIARWFNRVGTLKRLLPPEGCEPPYFQKNLLYNWRQIDAWKTAMRERLEGVQPLVTGAYMIKTPAGMDKLEGLLWCLGHVLEEAVELQPRLGPSLQEATRQLQQFPFLGSFMAYEVVTDLRHSILSEAPDIYSWANPGPGAARGLGRVLAGDPEVYNYNRRRDAEPLQQGMRYLLDQSRKSSMWPVDWPQWEMRDVEHTLCEFDKYERARLGDGTPKQRYEGGA